MHARIDLSALRHNLAVVRRRAPYSRVMAVVKSLGYGHGAIQVAQALAPYADALAVARIEEGVALREAGIEAPLTVLEGFVTGAHLELARRHALQLVIHAAQQLELLRADRSSRPVECWLKVDTGMHRLGFAHTRAGQFLAQLRNLPQVVPVGLMTHLANADDSADRTTLAQLERMQKAARGSDLPVSIANSAGILAWPDTHADWVRPGVMLYGASPLQHRTAAQLGLRPVMTLEAPLIAIKEIETGAPVGYGGVWRAPEPMPLGVVGIGYGDGYPRHVRVGTEVLLRGSRVPLVGRVSMDMITVDLRGMEDARVGDRATLFGEGLPVDELAGWADTIPYTLLCGVSARVARTYRD